MIDRADLDNPLNALKEPFPEPHHHHHHHHHSRPHLKRGKTVSSDPDGSPQSISSKQPNMAMSGSYETLSGSVDLSTPVTSPRKIPSKRERTPEEKAKRATVQIPREKSPDDKSKRASVQLPRKDSNQKDKKTLDSSSGSSALSPRRQESRDRREKRISRMGVAPVPPPNMMDSLTPNPEIILLSTSSQKSLPTPKKATTAAAGAEGVTPPANEKPENPVAVSTAVKKIVDQDSKDSKESPASTPRGSSSKKDKDSPKESPRNSAAMVGGTDSPSKSDSKKKTRVTELKDKQEKRRSKNLPNSSDQPAIKTEDSVVT